MPSKSAKQHDLMEAVKHNAKFAKKVGIPQSVGRDYVAADKRAGRYARGGSVLKELSGARMRPIPPVRGAADELRAADRAIYGARDRLRNLKGRSRGT